ncbi:MAG: Gfo/Idh/MocA family oxidoreductase [Bdellovibrionales bacterium]|nr:Gfo/Idh/MocA family oxidoreductase [Bdellovibrionales bacterium]
MASPAEINSAVVGVGHLGGFHAQKHAALAREGVRLVALVDPAVETVREKIAKGKVPEAPVFSSVEECLAAATAGKIPRIHAASVATTTETHVETGLRLLDAGVHLLVEKPLAMDSKGARKLVEEAERHKLVLATGKVERHRVMEVFGRIQGQPLFIECHRLSPFPARSTDIDVIFDLMIHDIDLMLAMVKSPIRAVHAAGFPVLTRHFDIANARFEFENGCVANLTASRISVTRTRKFRVFCSDAYLSLDLQTGEFNRYTKDPREPELEKAIAHESGSLTVGDPLLAEVRDFFSAVRGGHGPLVTGRDGLSAIEVAESVVADVKARLRELPPGTLPAGEFV